MGLLRVRVRIFSLRDEHRAREIGMVVDTGATYSVIPRQVADELDIGPTQERTFTLADGRRMFRRIGRAGLAYDGVEAASVVVIGEPDDVPLLGATALEELGMEVDPVAKALRPTTLYSCDPSRERILARYVTTSRPGTRSKRLAFRVSTGTRCSRVPAI